MENFEKSREKLIETLTGKEKLLLHSCCAPCSASVLERLVPHFNITVYYYNPNIAGEEEYQNRLSEQERFLTEAYRSVPILHDGHCGEDFYAAVQGLEREKEGGARCHRCFRLRLARLADRAKRDGFDFIATTLTVSPLKDAEVLNRNGQEEATRAGVKWLPSDFKKGNGYLRGVEISKLYHLYRQDFCGCEFSKKRDIR